MESSTTDLHRFLRKMMVVTKDFRMSIYEFFLVYFIRSPVVA